MSSPRDYNSVLVTASANENAAEFIRAMIVSGRLLPGEKLPTGGVLATRLGISIVTLRLGLKSLETRGFVVTSRGAHGGTRVSDLAGLMDCWHTWLGEHANELDDLIELRSTIETRIASLAAERRTASDLEALEEANALLTGPSALLAPWYVAFHDALAQAAHSKYLAAADFDAQSKLFIPPEDLASYPQRIRELTSVHARIVDAVRDQDSSAATEAMRIHLANTVTIIKKYLKSLGRAQDTSRQMRD